MENSNISNENDNKRFIMKKSLNISMLGGNKGSSNGKMTLENNLHNKFISNLSRKLTEENIKINYTIDNQIFNGSIVRLKGNNTGKIQITFDSKLTILLQNKFIHSYEYLRNQTNYNLPDDEKEFICFYVGEKKDTFELKFITVDNKEIAVTKDNDLDYIKNKKTNQIYTFNIASQLNGINRYINNKGFIYSYEDLCNFYLSLKTKPFVILSGISGTGKSKIVELFAEAVGANSDNDRFKLIPVRPDWSDATDLLGYRNIENKFIPGIIIDAAYEAMQNLDKPYFLCLDEMNLARVEYYFSDILSSMETRKINDDEIITQKLLSRAQFGKDERAYDKYGDVYIPQNLYIIGTVNMDETTFPFSKKVLDRANTIEFNKVDLKYNFEKADLDELLPKNYHNDFLKSQYLKISECKDEKDIATKVIDKLIGINKILEKYQQHFAYRVRDEIVFYVIYAVKNDLFSFDQAMDYSIVQKILPKISGSGGEVLDILVELFNILNDTKHKNDVYIEVEQTRAMENQCESSEYKLSSQKIMYMIRRFLRDGFTTFWQ